MTKNLFFNSALSSRSISLAVFAFFFSWLLAFPFEGQVIYALAEKWGIDPHTMIFSAIAAHFVGLFLTGFVVKTMKMARELMVFSIITAILTTALFFLPPSSLWLPALMISSFLAGGCVASWGFFFQAFAPRNERIKMAADGLIYSNSLMILLNITAIHISPQIGLGLCMLVLVLALLAALRLPASGSPLDTVSQTGSKVSVSKPLAFLYLFVAIITFNSGLMYQVLIPAFEHLKWLVSWYWALPYIIALYIIRNLPHTVNRTHILYGGIAMIGFAFLAFTVLDRTAGSYLIVNTLMLGACGIFDLFWWSILGEMMDFSHNPAAVFGIGLSANVFGVLAGGMTGQMIGGEGSQHSSLLALAIVCVVLVILPPLSNYLRDLLKTHAFLTTFAEMEPEKQRQTVKHLMVSEELTGRENEIAALIIQGKTYKQVASELYVSENTVKTHVKNIYAKYNVQNRSQLLHLMMGKSNVHLQ